MADEPTSTEQNHVAADCPNERIVIVQTDMLERWELHRDEMTNHMDRLAKLAVNFTKLGAFDDAAKCLIKAEGIKYVLGRMPRPAQ